MSAAEDTESALETVEDIREDGQSATLYVQDPAATPAWDPNYTADAGTAILILNLKRKIEVKDGSNIVQGREIMIARSPWALAPEIGDKIEVDSERFSILELEPFQPGSVIIFWNAKIGRGM